MGDDLDDKRPMCKYGETCYRSNPEHRENFRHEKQEEPSVGTTSPGKRKRESEKKDPRKLKQTKLSFIRQPLNVKREHAQVRKSPRKPQKAPMTIKKPCENGDLSVEEIDSFNSVDNRNIQRTEEITGASSKGEESERQRTLSRKKPPRKKQPVPIRKGVIEESSEEEEEKPKIECKDVEILDEPLSPHVKVESSASKEDLACKTPQEKIKRLFLVDMPADFYEFFEFCESWNSARPLHALANYGLTLVGPFDVLAGTLSPGDVPPERALCHWRFYMDPPEFQTVLTESDGTHYGYWRDEPSSRPFIVSNTIPSCTIRAVAPNLFAAVRICLENYIRKCSPFEKPKASKFLNSLKHWASERDFVLSETADYMEERRKAVNAKTFNEHGIVVPYDKKNDIGYRPLGESNAYLKKLCLSIKKSKSPDVAKMKMIALEELANFANIANDEMDFGNGLELGMDLFCMGSHHFSFLVDHLLSTAYGLLQRPEWAEIIQAHLKNRTTKTEPSVLIKR